MAVSMIIPLPQQQSLSPRTALHDKRIKSHNRRVALRRHQGVTNLLQSSSHHENHEKPKDEQQNDLAIEIVVSAPHSSPTTISSPQESSSSSIISNGGTKSSIGSSLDDSSHHSFRTEQHTNNKHNNDNKSAIGMIVASDVAYVDQVLSSSSSSGTSTFDMNQLFLYSDRKFHTIKQNSQYVVSYTHSLLYKGETVWELETSCDCDTLNGRDGITSTCTLKENDTLIVRIANHVTTTTSDKNTNKTTTTRRSNTTVAKRDRYVLSLTDILLQSAMNYEIFACEEAAQEAQT